MEPWISLRAAQFISGLTPAERKQVWRLIRVAASAEDDEDVHVVTLNDIDEASDGEFTAFLRFADGRCEVGDVKFANGTVTYAWLDVQA